MKGFNIFLLLVLLTATGLMTSTTLPKRVVSNQEQSWVDSVYNALTPEQRLGQLFMVAAYSNRDASHSRYIERLISQYNIGGLMFMYGGPKRQAILTNQYQSKATVPLFIAMDAEWGLDMRLDSSMHFAKQMTLGALDDPKYVYLMGREIALKMKRLGVHISFSPVLDVNSNPNNPVIGNRSFGESKEHVSDYGISYIKGLQENGIIAVAKHFPGHGDTDKDSHKSLPIIRSDIKRLQEVDLYPFKQSFDAGVMGVMVAHLHLPVFDTVANKAATLSHNLVTGLLKEKMQYQGLVFTDALNMRSVTKYYKPGEVDALALSAGNDVLLFSEDVPTAIAKIKEAVASGKIKQEEIDYKVRKILHAKYWAGLNKYKPVELKNLTTEIDRPSSNVVQQQLYEHAVTLVKNKGDFLPFRNLDTLNFASVTIGAGKNNVFTQTLEKYAPFTKYTLVKQAEDSTYNRLYNKLQQNNVVVVSIHRLNNTPANNYGITQRTRAFIQRLQANPKQKVVLAVLGNAYTLQYFEKSDWLLCGYEDTEAAQTVIPQILFGAIGANGKLPVSASPNLTAGSGLKTQPINRLRFANPESVGMDSQILNQIDNVAREAIAYGATPGCQVVVAKDGAVIFEKAYGYTTYDDKAKLVTNSSIYDIASVTKVASTLQAIMFLKDQGKLNLDAKASVYLPELQGTNKQNLIIRDILAHQAGLQSGVAFWQRSFNAPQNRGLYYATTQSENFPNEVVPGMYTAKNMEDVMWKWIIESPLLPKPKGAPHYEFKYSDLSFYILRRVAEKLLNQSIDEFMEHNFYASLGANSLLYNPLKRFQKEQIVPTENDTHFRKTLVWGNVHDQGAAMMGGVAGHAGLFSTALDLAKLMQMNLQNGEYGGLRYFRANVVPEFATRHNKETRRGLGWDMPDPAGKGATSTMAPLSTFGHTGFTGTCAWVDPENKLVYIFLSNRINPTAENNKLVTNSIRTRIHDIIYKSIQPKFYYTDRQ